MKVSLIKQFFGNRIYGSNTQNANFDYLPFGGDEMLITRQRLYCINYHIVFRLNNGSSVYVKMDQM